MDRRTSRALTLEEMHEATLKGERGNFNLAQAIQTMLEYKEKGESVSYRFNGFKLESDKISEDNVDKVQEEYIKALSSKLPRELYLEEIHEATLKGKRGNFNLAQAVEAMLEYKEKGESVYYVFNGFELNSDEITTVEETLEMYDTFLREEAAQKRTMPTEEVVRNEGMSSNKTESADIRGQLSGQVYRDDEISSETESLSFKDRLKNKIKNLGKDKDVI